MHIHRTRTARLLIGISLAALIVGTAITVRERRAMEAMRATGLRLESLVDSVDSTRAPLYGEGTTGLAHEEYRRGLELLDPEFARDWNHLRKTREAESGSEPSSAADELHSALVVGGKASLAALRRGAHHLDSKMPIDWKAGLNGKEPRLSACRNLVNLAVLAADVELEAGHPAKAVDLLLDGMQFGADLAQCHTAMGEMIGNAVLGITTHGAILTRQIYLRLPPIELARLTQGLAEIDARLAHRGLAFEAALARFARTASVTEDVDSLFGTELAFRTLRNGFLARLEWASMVEEELRLQAELVGMESLPWQEAESRFTDLAAREGVLGQTLWGGNRRSMEVSHRTGLTWLRLARTAIDIRLGNHARPLADPFGHELRVSKTEDGTKIQSVGPDSFPNEHLVVIVPAG